MIVERKYFFYCSREKVIVYDYTPIFYCYSKLRYSLPHFWSLCCVINGRYNCLLQNMLLQRDLFYRRIECFVCFVQNVYLSRKKLWTFVTIHFAKEQIQQYETVDTFTICWLVIYLEMYWKSNEFWLCHQIFELSVSNLKAR